MIITSKTLTMKRLFFSLLAAVALSSIGAANDDLPAPPSATAVAGDTTKATSLFDAENVLNIKLSGNIKELINDRSDVVKNHGLSLSYKDADGSEVSVPTTVRTRGHFRKSSETCTYPPLLLQFAKTEPVKGSLFGKYSKLKLVMPCQGDQYVVREWMVYRLYNLVTPKSLRARLVSVQLEDAKKKTNATPFYGILLEEEKDMARRNNASIVNAKLVRPEHTEKQAFLTMAVFQYLIGNTDWSVQYQQNIKLISTDPSSIPVAVAYDFDHAGIVNAPYARPAEELLMSSVQERRYRGYCIADMEEFAEVVTRYNNLKEEIYQLYSSCPLLDPKYVKTTLKYFDSFYATINNPKEMQKQFGYPCDKNGTGNIVIKGLKKD
jgi:hypothetical protein